VVILHFGDQNFGSSEKLTIIYIYIYINDFRRKMIFSKIFFGVWFARKNYEMQKSEFGKCCRNPATSGEKV
jgi:hypothetical protein